MRGANLPNIIAVSAVVPEEREDSREHVFANAASVSINDRVTTFSSSKGKSASSTMTLGKWSRANCAAPFPTCPSNTNYLNKLPFTCQCHKKHLKHYASSCFKGNFLIILSVWVNKPKFKSSTSLSSWHHSFQRKW